MNRFLSMPFIHTNGFTDVQGQNGKYAKKIATLGSFRKLPSSTSYHKGAMLFYLDAVHLQSLYYNAVQVSQS